MNGYIAMEATLLHLFLCANIMSALEQVLSCKNMPLSFFRELRCPGTTTRRKSQKLFPNVKQAGKQESAVIPLETVPVC